MTDAAPSRRPGMALAAGLFLITALISAAAWHTGAASLYRAHLDIRCGTRHHDGRFDPQTLSRQRQPLRMVTRRCSDHAFGSLPQF